MPPLNLPSASSKCVCGGDMRVLASNLYHCPVCRRSRWIDERLPGSVFGVIALVVFVGLIVLGIVGADGARYR